MQQMNSQLITINKISKKIFGYPFLKDFQEKVILEILSGNDVFAVLGMSSGKSLCYQLSSLLLEGLTIVISPLKIIMEEQVKFLRQKNIFAEAYHLVDFDSLYKMIVYQKLKILFLSSRSFLPTQNESIS